MTPFEKIGDRLMAIVETQTCAQDDGEAVAQSELHELAKFIGRALAHEGDELEGRVLNRWVRVKKWTAHGELEISVRIGKKR